MSDILPCVSVYRRYVIFPCVSDDVLRYVLVFKTTLETRSYSSGTTSNSHRRSPALSLPPSGMVSFHGKFSLASFFLTANRTSHQRSSKQPWYTLSFKWSWSWNNTLKFSHQLQVEFWNFSAWVTHLLVLLDVLVSLKQHWSWLHEANALCTACSMFFVPVSALRIPPTTTLASARGCHPCLPCL